MNTAKEAALDMIRKYVLRGDSYDSITHGNMGCAYREYSAQIGGLVLIDGKRKDFTRRYLIVTKLNSVECRVIFTVAELIKEIKNEVKNQVKQESLWEVS